jgi:hypothetical protein
VQAVADSVKSGKRIRPLPKPRRTAIVPACNSKLANLDATDVIRRYLEDQTTAVIAQELGVHRSGLHQWLLRNCEEHWREAQIARALTQHEQAKDELAAATDILSLGRARERLRSAQWELERLFSRLYGAKQEVRLEVNVNLADRLVKARERVIEPDAVHQIPNSEP